MSSALRYLVRISIAIVFLSATGSACAADSSSCLDTKPGAAPAYFQTKTMQTSDGVCLRSRLAKRSQHAARHTQLELARFRSSC